MTIDRVPPATSPRIDKSTVAFAQAPFANGEADAPESGQPSFSSVLSTLAADPAGGGDTLTSKGTDAVPIDGPLYPPTVQMAPVEAVPDPAALLVQMTGDGKVAIELPPQAPMDGLPQGPGISLVGPSLVTPGAGQQVKAAGVPAMPHGPRTDGADESALPYTSPAADVGPASTASGTLALGRTMGAGMQNDTMAAARDDGASLRSGGGRQDSGDPVVLRGDWRAALANSAERMIPLTPLFVDVAGGGFRSLAASRGTERQPARSVFLPLDAAAPGSVASPTYASPSASGALPSAMPDAPMAPGASADVAQKVHYWVTRGVQNAELQLDAFGGSAVDVSISLQGKEALVEFRSDQPEARRVLQDAMPQLRDMLRNEGLQLAGGFVGTSAQQQDESQRRTANEQAQVRTGTVSLADAATDRSRGHRPATPHALDVFV